MILEKTATPMFSPEAAISRELTSMFPANSAYKNVLQSEFLKTKQPPMGSGSDLYPQQSSGGLMRYRSAPSSFFAGIMDGAAAGSFSAAALNEDGAENFVVNDGSSSSDSESMFSSMLNCGGSGSDSRDLKNCMRFMKAEIAEEQSNRNGNGIINSCEAQQISYEAPEMTSFEIPHQHFRTPSNLLRQSSSPAGFFSGFDVIGEAGNYKCNDGANNSLSSNGFNNNQSSNYMPSIAENESWNDSSFNCLKRTRDGDFKMLSSLNGMENQNGEPRNCAPGLTHHLSLPTNFEMEKYLHFQQQDTVPCKIRAKRGCATHPRSIAERNRRTRISERMKKLQELFPKMDKQTSTADMLDWAVEHIKELQKQVQILEDKKAKCACSSEMV